MRRGIGSYLDLGFVEEARDGTPKGEPPREAPSPLESTGARRFEPVKRSHAPAPMASRAPGGFARALLWLLGGLLVLFLAGVTFFVLVSPSATPGGGHARAAHRKMVPKKPAPAHPALPAATSPAFAAPKATALPAPSPTALPAPKSRPAPEAVPPKPVSVATLVGVLLGATVAVGALSALVGLLRRLKNPLYWQLACWMLVVVGIAVRPVVVSASGLPTPGQLLVSVAVGLAVLPGLMRWLNRVSPRPGLQHVAVPFSLGFFLDLTQVLAASFNVKLPWIPS